MRPAFPCWHGCETCQAERNTARHGESRRYTRRHSRQSDFFPAPCDFMRGFFCVSICRAIVCPGLLAGFKGAAALLPMGVDIRLDIHFVCPPPIRPMASAGRGTGRERGLCCFPFTKKAGRSRRGGRRVRHKKKGAAVDASARITLEVVEVSGEVNGVDPKKVIRFYQGCAAKSAGNSDISLRKSFRPYSPKRLAARGFHARLNCRQFFLKARSRQESAGKTGGVKYPVTHYGIFSALLSISPVR